MNEIPSVLQSILRKRYLNEAVTMAPQVSYTKKEEEEEEPFPSPRLAPTSPTVQPELKVPAASEFPELTPTVRDILSRIRERAASETLETPKELQGTTPKRMGDSGRTERPATPQELERLAASRVVKRSPYFRSQNAPIETRMSFGIPPIPEEQISRAAQATKSGVEKAIAGAKKFDAYATQKAPYSWPTIKDLPKHGMYFGASIPVFDAFYRAAEQHTPFEPGLGGMDPYSFTVGTVGTATTIPFAVETARALGRGLGLMGSLGQGAAAAAPAIASSLTWIPPAAYAGAYALEKAEEEYEPSRKEKAREIDAALDYAKTKRRLEGRTATFGEKFMDSWLESEKYKPLFNYSPF